jgi:hypothetical protein
MTFLKHRRRVSLTEFTNIFVPFGILTFLALMAAELTQNLILFRAVYSIWVTMIFLVPAVCLYVLPGKSEAKHNYWLLLWTFGFLAYLVHFYYTVFVIFNGSIPVIYAEQGVVVATSNFLVTLWWGLDVLLGWFVDLPNKIITLQRAAAHIYIPATFFVSAVLIKTGFVRALGIVMTVAILLCLAIRIRAELDSSKKLTVS